MRRFVSTVFLILTSTVSLSAADRSEPLFRGGQEALLRGDYDKASDLLEKAVAQNSRIAEYHYWLGSAYGQRAQKANVLSQAMLARKTKEEFELTVKLDPRHQDGRFGLIDFYLIAPGFMGGSEEKAAAQAGELRKIDPLAGHRAWARIYRHQKKDDLARKEMLDAVREQPASPRAHYYLGMTWMAEKNFKSALDEFESAIRLDAAFAPSWFRAGQSAALGAINLPRGEELLRKYLSTKPDIDAPPLARAWFWLGNIQEKQGRKADAQQSFRNSLKLKPAAKDVSEALKRVS